jgi:hypothetical protein
MSMEEQKRLTWALKQLILTIEIDLEEFLQERRHRQKALNRHCILHINLLNHHCIMYINLLNHRCILYINLLNHRCILRIILVNHRCILCIILRGELTAEDLNP